MFKLKVLDPVQELRRKMEALPRTASSRGSSDFCLLLRSSWDKKEWTFAENLNEMVPLNLLTARCVSWAWAINLKLKHFLSVNVKLHLLMFDVFLSVVDQTKCLLLVSQIWSGTPEHYLLVLTGCDSCQTSCHSCHTSCHTQTPHYLLVLTGLK